MKRLSKEQSLSALLTASRNRDADSVASIWRELTPAEQESVLFTLLAHTDAHSEAVPVEPDERPDPLMHGLGDTAAMEAVAEQTELIPKAVEDLRGLTGSERDETEAPQASTAAVNEPTEYWSRWLQRWKWSALVAAWAVTTIFAFTWDTSAFGPMEWVVAIFGTVVGGGVLVGTLLNFAVAAIPTQHQAPR
jgi:hypothetical protein